MYPTSYILPVKMSWVANPTPLPHLQNGAILIAIPDMCPLRKSLNETIVGEDAPVPTEQEAPSGQGFR